MRDSRLKTKHIAEKLALVAPVVAHLSGPVDQLDALHPLIDCEVDLASEVVKMTEERADDLASPGRRVRARGRDDALREGRVELVLLWW